MDEVLNFEEGIEAIIKKIDQSDVRPFLVVVYGNPDSGKTHLIAKLAEYYTSKGIQVADYKHVHPGVCAFENVRDWKTVDIFLFHMGTLRYVGPDGNLLLSENSPDVLAPKIANREINLSVGIYNPDRNGVPQGRYDLIISNLGSVIKKGGFDTD